MNEKDLFPKDEENDNELFEHYRFISDPGQGLLRVDKFLSSRITNSSRSKIQAAANAGNIRVNEKIVKPNYRIKPGDTISVLLSFPPRDSEIIPENIPLSIVYEDDDVIIIDKKAGMVVHPAYANYTGTLVNAVAWHLKDKVNNDSNWGGYLVHRIDKDTSGLIVITKNENAQAVLARQFFEHSVEREYIALVWGDFENDEDTITGNLGRSPKDRRVMTVFKDENKGKHAITHYKVIERFGYVTLISCKLETGRTHQIRAHLSYIGHPLFNDATYGGNTIIKGTTFTKYRQFIDNCFKLLPRQALHAKTLGFKHPSNGKQISFSSSLPDDIVAVINKWKRYSQFSINN